MSRPKKVVYENFKNYDKLHSEPTKMISGVQLNILYPIKETKEYYISCEVWASCASQFKRKKKNIGKLEVNIKTLTDKESVNFLEKNCWGGKELDSDEKEASEFLRKLYPEHKFKYFYELSNLINSFSSGKFVRYDNSGNEAEATERDKDVRGSYIHKYNLMYGVIEENNVPHVKALYDKYDSYRKDKDSPNYSEDKQNELFSAYFEAERKYLYENLDMTSIFRSVGEHAVCLPMAFSNGTADWYKEKYGETCAYAHAGESFFVVTSDSIFIDVSRHF
jgi:hypothetical protein